MVCNYLNERTSKFTKHIWLNKSIFVLVHLRLDWISCGRLKNMFLKYEIFQCCLQFGFVNGLKISDTLSIISSVKREVSFVFHFFSILKITNIKIGWKMLKTMEKYFYFWNSIFLIDLYIETNLINS